MKSSEIRSLNFGAANSTGSTVDDKSNKMQRVVLACMVGNALEWYDFVIYGYFAEILGRLFFPQSDHLSSILTTLGVFAVGFVARPLGSVIFGHIGDKLSRRTALLASIYVMAVPTLLIGLLPTYNQIGVTAPILLIILRILQGIAIGGEFTGSMVFMVEHASERGRGLAGSWATCSLVLGVIVGSSVATAFIFCLEQEALETWGWRVPFIISVVGSVIGARMRRKLVDPETYTKAKQERKSKSAPLKELISNYTPKILLVVLLDFLTAIGFFLIVVFLSVYFKNYLHMPPSISLLINTINMIIFAMIIPLGGWLSDIYGRKIILGISSFAFIVGAYPLFISFSQQSYVCNGLLQTALVIFMGLFFGTLPATLAEMFPSHVRFSGLSLGHNLSMAIFGGTAPWIAASLIKWTGNIHSPAYMLVVAAALSLSSLMFFKDKYKQKLE